MQNVLDSKLVYESFQNNMLSYTFDIIIPAYNEENRIRPVLDEVSSFIYTNDLPWNVIVSIDGDDKTSDIVNGYGKKFRFIKSIKNTGRNGKGKAISNILSFVNSEYVFLMDADNSMQFHELINAIKSLNSKYDIILFNRYNKMNKIPFIRKFISRGFNFLVRSILKLRVGDTQTGYKIINSNIFKKAMNKVTVTNTFFDVTMLYYLKKMGARMIEITVKYSHNYNSKFHALGEIIGQGSSLIAFRIRQSRIFKYVPNTLILLYYKIFKWI